jgi:hypothetical protein
MPDQDAVWLAGFGKKLLGSLGPLCMPGKSPKGGGSGLAGEKGCRV